MNSKETRRVHITLTKSVADNAARRDEAVRAIVAKTGLSEINEKRLTRYGIFG